MVLAKKYHLPLFLHSRAAHNDFVQILREEGFGEDGGKAVGGRGGVVHSFTGSVEEANDYVCIPQLEHSRLIQLSDTFSLRSRWDFILGLLSSSAIRSQRNLTIHSINGCSLKTEDNLAAVKSIDRQRIMFETGTSCLTKLSVLAYSHACDRCSMVFHDFHTGLKKTRR